MSIIQRKYIRKTLVVELLFLSIAICISILAITSSYQLLVFSEIRFPDIYYEFEGMYLLLLLLFVLSLIELVFLIHLFGFIKSRKNISWTKSIVVIVVVHILLGVLSFYSIKYTITGSNTNEVSQSFYIFVLLFLIECGIIGYILSRLHLAKKIT